MPRLKFRPIQGALECAAVGLLKMSGSGPSIKRLSSNGVLGSSLDREDEKQHLISSADLWNNVFIKNGFTRFKLTV